MDKKQAAGACFRKGFSCSQAVLSAFSAGFDLDTRMALKVAGAFGGGMARMGETCGAVTGALMVIGLKFGMTDADDQQAKEKTYETAHFFVAAFRSAHGSITCKELLGCDISTPSGFRDAKERGLFTTICPQLVEHAVEALEETLKR